MPTPHGFVERLAEMSRSGVPFVCVTMVEAVGSTPQDAGSKMLVTAQGLVSGTIGGGRVEAKAIDVAKKMLASAEDKEIGRLGDKEQGQPADPLCAQQGETRAQQAEHSPCPPLSVSPCLLQEWNLKRDVGMTCGGTVKLFFEAYNHGVWRIVVFGAGHVANAVVQCLGQLDCHVTCIDPRPDWLDRIPHSARLQKICCDDPRTMVAQLPAGAFIICMTMGHATDRPILEEIFRQGRTFPFLGVIGSKAKRAVLLKELAEVGIPAEQANAFHCPIGLAIGTNQPGEIAVSIVAQLIQERDRWRHN
jgi:xanthine dehydrogenase accessory factor